MNDDDTTPFNMHEAYETADELADDPRYDHLTIFAGRIQDAPTWHIDIVETIRTPAEYKAWRTRNEHRPR